MQELFHMCALLQRTRRINIIVPAADARMCVMRVTCVCMCDVCACATETLVTTSPICLVSLVRCNRLWTSDRYHLKSPTLSSRNLHFESELFDFASSKLMSDAAHTFLVFSWAIRFLIVHSIAKCVIVSYVRWIHWAYMLSKIQCPYYF